MTELTRLTLAEARDGLKAKGFTAVELTEAHLGPWVGRGTQRLGHRRARPWPVDRAKSSDARLAKGKAGAMDGLPIGMKDLFCTEGVRTTASSRILEIHPDLQIPPYRPISRRPARWSWARPRATNSPWGRRT